ncbi:MAG: TIR domain-containing protein [Psychroflexus sp.]
MTDEAPKLFISYSWSNIEHEEWVLNLASEIRENGVNVILDKWDLKEGHDSVAFMEKMVSDPEVTKVIIVSDKVYAEKANSRKGGVGTETQIISPELYSEQEQDKFVAVVKDKDDNGKPYLPTYYKSRIYIDLSEEEIYAKNFEQLLRWIFNQPLHKKPEIGKKPSYLEDESHVQLGTSSKYRRALNSIKEGKNNWKGALSEYFETLSENIEKFRIETDSGEIDEKVINSIEEFLPYRNDLLQLFSVLSKYLKNDNEAHQMTHKFFELLIPYNYRKEISGSYREWDFDNFRFITNELFLYAIAIMIRNQAYEFVSYLLSNRYYYDDSSYGNSNLKHFSDFYHHLKSLEYRNNRLEKRRISLHADLLIKRCEGSGLSKNQLMEADLILYLRSCNDSNKDDNRYFWYPLTLVYAVRGGGTSFENFARSRSKSFFNKFKTVLGLNSLEEFNSFMELFKGNNNTPRFDGWPLNISALTNAQEIGTLG